MRNETWKLLTEYDVAYTNVDEPLLSADVHLTTDLSYFRWHGRGKKIWFDYRYSKKELDFWVPKVQDAAGKVNKIVGYFHNQYHGYAPDNCKYLIEKLGLFSDKEKQERKAMPKQSSLFDYAI